MKQSDKITVELEQSPSHAPLWDVVGISCDLAPLESCAINGLDGCDTLIIGSWLRKFEIKNRSGLKTKNKRLHFVVNNNQ